MSKEALQEAQTIMGSSSLPQLRRLIISIDGDSIVVTGVVASYHQKQMAQECLKEVARKRAMRVLNRTEVRTNS